MGKKVAYASDTLTLDKATWDTVFGMYVEFRLKQDGHEVGKANPFKSFTRRRKGRTGTRFMSVFTIPDSRETIIYDDEVMLKGWSDGTAGWKVTLYVQQDSDGLHPFMNCEKGDVFAVAMAELDDDNEVIDQEKRDRLEDAHEGRKAPRLSNYAAQLCRDPNFIRYIGDRCGERPSGEEHADEFSAEWMRKLLGVESRRELDSDPDVAARFHKNIREPYRKWHRANA